MLPGMSLHSTDLAARLQVVYRKTDTGEFSVQTETIPAVPGMAVEIVPPPGHEVTSARATLFAMSIDPADEEPLLPWQREACPILHKHGPHCGASLEQLRDQYVKIWENRPWWRRLLFLPNPL